MPHATANNLTGCTKIPLVLTQAVAQTWTHNFNSLPLKVELYASGVNVQGAGATQCAVTTTVNSITLTPGGSYGVAVATHILIWWANPPQFTQTARTPNFA